MTKMASDVWFPEPSVEDPSWARDRESTVSWLNRSTKPRAREVRRFLNENIERLPKQVRSSFARALSHRWESALFEMVVARALQEWSAQLEIEVPNQEGRCPDILAHFADGDVAVEATCPLYNKAMGSELADKNPLVRLIEKAVPVGYRVGVWEVPWLSQSQSRHHFKETIKALFEPFTRVPAEQIPLEGIELAAEMDQGEIRLMLFPKRVLKDSNEDDDNRSLFGPSVSGMDNSELRIINAVKTKRSQVRSSTVPAILALHGGNLGADLEDFDRALIGHSWERIEFAGNRTYVTERGFHLDGELYRRPSNEKPPTYAGVLALLDVGIFGIKDWAFYPHPRFKGALPEPFGKLPVRAFDQNTQAIKAQEGQSPGEASQKLNFASQHV